MASVLSEASSSTTTTTHTLSPSSPIQRRTSTSSARNSPVSFTSSSTIPSTAFNPNPFHTLRTFREDPIPQAVIFNRLVTEAFHGESSPELRNAELERAATRALLSIGVAQQRTMSMDVDQPPSSTKPEDDSRASSRSQSHPPSVPEEPAKNEGDESVGDLGDVEGWQKIQEYGQFLRQSAETFRSEGLSETPSPPIARRTFPLSPQPLLQQPTTSTREVPSTTVTRGSAASLGAKQISPFEWLSWRHFRFNADFSGLAPLTARENRIHAEQSAKLIDWILNPLNDRFFRGWGSLDQIPNLPSETPAHETVVEDTREEERVLEHILEDTDEAYPPYDPQRPSLWPVERELGWRPPVEGQNERLQTSFARYLLQEAPSQGRLHQASQGQEQRFVSTGLFGSDNRMDEIQRQDEGEVARGTSVQSTSRSGSFGGAKSDDDARSVVSEDNHWRRTIFG